MEEKETTEKENIRYKKTIHYKLLTLHLEKE